MFSLKKKKEKTLLQEQHLFLDEIMLIKQS